MGTTHEYIVHLVLFLSLCDRLKPWQGGPVLIGKLLSGEELSKEFFDGHWADKAASHFVVHIVAQLFDGRLLDGRKFPSTVAGVFSGRAEDQ